MLSLFSICILTVLINLLLMNKRVQFCIFFILLLSIVGCFFPKKNNAVGNEKDKIALMNADNSFSNLSAEKGMKNAFLEYIDSNGVLLRPNVIPIAGADAVDYIIALKDEGYTMTWKPNDATVAASGELGYTYGSYILQPATKDTVFYGTYVSIWKKQDDGKWKFILQSANEGLGEE
jgi:ketosteroid isomerase-like protein